MQRLRLSLNTPAQRLSDVARCCAIPESSQRLGLQTDLTLFTAEDQPRGLDHIVAVKHGVDWAEHGTRFLTLHAQAGKIPQCGGLERSNLGCNFDAFSTRFYAQQMVEYLTHPANTFPGVSQCQTPVVVHHTRRFELKGEIPKHLEICQEKAL
ncbi:hypothetical protein B0H13DRAFT_1921707 [Mycena leptocephala]|nr:hypothetical protein B0H13DRAFT_1921707 [Mycena leptocephala]